MKIYVFNFRKCVMMFGAIALLIASIIVASSSIPKAITVSSTKRVLPIYYVETEDKKASITFDCAWGAEDIPQILDTLREESVKATFFIVGHWAEKYPEIVKKIAADGHDIASHSYGHLRMGALDNEKIRSDITKSTQVLSEISGQKVDLFRPPYGDYSNNVVSNANDLGVYTIQWNVDSLDWKPGISQEEILNRVTRKIEPGSIILFHNDTPHTAKLLPTIISTLKNQGYDLLPVSQLIIKENYEIDFDGKQRRKK